MFNGEMTQAGRQTVKYHEKDIVHVLYVLIDFVTFQPLWNEITVKHHSGKYSVFAQVKGHEYENVTGCPDAE